MAGTRPRLADQDNRDRINRSLDETLVVEAAAGTGKTTELVGRILNVLKRGRDANGEPIGVRHLVAVTFTEKAAGELKLRLREALERERANGSVTAGERDRLTEALATLEEAHVSTIHGFCAEMLRERPVEARIDPLFAVLTETQADRLYGRAFQAWFEEQLAEPPEGVRRSLRRSSSPVFQAAGPGDGDGPVDRLRRAGRDLRGWRDFETAWQRPSYDRDADIRHLVDALHVFTEITKAPAWDRDRFFLDTEAARQLSRQIALERSIGREDLDGWEGRLVDLARERHFARANRSGGAKYSKDATRTQVLDAYDRLLAALQTFKANADADLAARLQQELQGSIERYEGLKTRAGALDYEDLLIKTRNLLRDDESVRRKLQADFKRIFVDEFQDTDPLQAEILLLLSADDPGESNWQHVTPQPGKLFIVGDPKQAIYRFRRADVGVYHLVREQLVARGAAAVALNTSFRSVPEIQKFVNAGFAASMRENVETMQAEYEPLFEHRAAIGDQPAVIALPVPRPYGGGRWRKIAAKAIEESLPEAVAAQIDWLLASDLRVTERGSDGTEQPRPIAARDVCILFRRFTSWGEDVTRRYVQALEARGIPHLLVGGRSFHEREEIEALKAALTAVEWPDDELSVYAALHGPLFAIGDAELLEYHHRFEKQHFGALHPYRIPPALGGASGREMALDAEPLAHLRPIADALRLLRTLHARRNYRPVAETINQLLTETRAHVGFALRQGGEQALANVLHVAELARQYELDGGLSFRGFIEELRESADEASAAEAPILEEGSDGVRMMTVHRAKGLEFPVVVLADVTCKLNRADAGRYIDPARNLCALKIGGWAPTDLLDHEALEVARDREEGIRLAYVAATRARDLLVVPAVGDEPFDGGWIEPLNSALYPPVGARRSPQAAPGCPKFRSKDTVLERPDGDPAGEATVAPGLHAFDAGYRVVWWDPTSLDLGVEPNDGLRREDLIVKNVDAALVAEDLRRYETWRAARDRAANDGRRPTIAVQTARAWVAGEAPLPDGAVPPASVQLLAAPIAKRRSKGAAVPAHGPAFGALVHALLATAPLDAHQGGGAALEQVAALEARLLGANDDDVAAAIEAVERALAAPILDEARAAAAAGRCRREAPVTIALENGLLVDGIVDLAFERDGTWTVVDYKTDLEIAANGEAQYRRQVALYATAIAKATGKPAAGVLLRV
jgi:ATP-dependent exoDNAse (exonuclease V) beta subunit